MITQRIALLGLTLLAVACEGDKSKITPITPQERTELETLGQENETLKQDNKALGETLSEKEKVIEQQFQEILSLKREAADKEAAEQKVKAQS